MSHYTQEEFNYLRENYSKLSNKELAEHLGRTTGAIIQKAHQSYLTKTIWNPIRDKLVIENYKKMNTKELASKIPCNVRQLYNRAVKLGLNKKHKQ